MDDDAAVLILWRSDDRYRLIVEHDFDAPNPREDQENTAVFHFPKPPVPGDPHSYSPDEVDAAICLPVYAYIHSGLALALHPFHCPWDSGPIGWAYIGEKTLDRLGLPNNIDQLTRIIEAELAEYQAFCNGEVYQFRIEQWDGDCPRKPWDVVDACGGFIGRSPYDNGMVDHWPEWAREAYDDLQSAPSE